MFVRLIRVGSTEPAVKIDALEKEVKDMKWYYFGLLSLLVCTFHGLLGWYIGGLENPYVACAAVVMAAVVYWVRYMKWYYFGLLSLLVCTFSGLLGWYITGGLENLNRACVAVVMAAVAYWVMSASMDFKNFKRQFSYLTSNVHYTILHILCALIYAALLLVSHHRHLPHIGQLPG